MAPRPADVERVDVYAITGRLHATDDQLIKLATGVGRWTSRRPAIPMTPSIPTSR